MANTWELYTGTYTGVYTGTENIDTRGWSKFYTSWSEQEFYQNFFLEIWDPPIHNFLELFRNLPDMRKP